MNNVFILFDGVGDGEYIISVHSSLEIAKQAGDEYLKTDKNAIAYGKYIRVEEWGIDNRAMISCWDKASYKTRPEYSFDWRKDE
jgi:hypothetical protein